MEAPRAGRLRVFCGIGCKPLIALIGGKQGATRGYDAGECPLFPRRGLPTVCGDYPVDRPTVLPPSSHTPSLRGRALAPEVTASSPW